MKKNISLFLIFVVLTGLMPVHVDANVVALPQMVDTGVKLVEFIQACVLGSHLNNEFEFNDDASGWEFDQDVRNQVLGNWQAKTVDSAKVESIISSLDADELQRFQALSNGMQNAKAEGKYTYTFDAKNNMDIVTRFMPVAVEQVNAAKAELKDARHIDNLDMVFQGLNYIFNPVQWVVAEGNATFINVRGVPVVQNIEEGTQFRATLEGGGIAHITPADLSRFRYLHFVAKTYKPPRLCLTCHDLFSQKDTIKHLKANRVKSLANGYRVYEYPMHSVDVESFSYYSLSFDQTCSTTDVFIPVFFRACPLGETIEEIYPQVVAMQVFEGVATAEDVPKEVGIPPIANLPTSDYSDKYFDTVVAKNDLVSDSETKVNTGAEGSGEGTIVDLSGLWSFLNSFWEKLLNTLRDLIASIFAFSWDNVIGAISMSDYYNQFRGKFKVFFDVTDLFKNIQANLSNAPPVLTIKLPLWLGGQEVVILDFSTIAVPIKWGRTFIRAALWYNFAVWILKLFEPKLGVE